MTGAASGIVLGFLLATAYGAGFHLLLGGTARRIAYYLLASWVGFIIGHFTGQLLNIQILQLGSVNLLSASIGSWLALILAWQLAEAGNR